MNDLLAQSITQIPAVRVLPVRILFPLVAALPQVAVLAWKYRWYAAFKTPASERFTWAWQIAVTVPLVIGLTIYVVGTLSAARHNQVQQAPVRSR